MSDFFRQAFRTAILLCLLGAWMQVLGAIPVDNPLNYTLTNSSFSRLLSNDYPRTNLRISLIVHYVKPGTILDTVGINAAPVGSFAVKIGGDGRPYLMIYDPGKPSAVKANNGWHVITASSALKPKTKATLEINVGEQESTLAVNGIVEKRVALAAVLSGKPIYIGDIPDDDVWGLAYNIHPAMTGMLQVSYLGVIPPASRLHQIVLTGPTFSSLLTKSYPRTNLHIGLTVNYVKPGTILDTVGINAAPIGSFGVKIDGSGRPFIMIYDPGKQSAARTNNGWHVISAKTALPPGTDGTIDIDIGEKQIVLAVNGAVEKRVALKATLSGKPVYIGDIPDDDRWGPAYNIHPAMTGTVQVRQFGAISSGTVIPTPLPVVTPDTPITTVQVSGTSAAGLQDIGKTLAGKDPKTAVQVLSPTVRKDYQDVFTQHPEAMTRLAALLATARPVFEENRYAEYEVTENGHTFSVSMEKLGTHWYLTQF